MWEIKFSQARTSEFFSSMWWITWIFREVEEKLTACLLKSNCHTNVVISQVSQIYIAALIWFPALYFQCYFESVTFHWVYQGKARMVFKLKKQTKKVFNFENIWKRQYLSFHKSDQKRGFSFIFFCSLLKPKNRKTFTNQQTCSFWVFSLKKG